MDPFIRVRDLSKSFRAKTTITHALDSTSFDLQQGEFLSVVGPSGCGKSTLLMLVSGLTSPTTGTVEIGGRQVTSPISDVGIAFQEDLLLEWHSTLDNILMQGAFRGVSKRSLRDRATELLDMVGLAEFADKYPHELSGGMRQRASICRALVHKPPLLLMDEPFGALDAMTRDQMALDIQDLLAGTNTTVLFITHSIAEAVMLSDRVLVFGPPPGNIVDELVVDLPRPRHLSVRETPEFAAFSGRIRSRLEAMGVIRDRTAWASGTASAERN
ncbi:MAG: ABC transporter ATP-binding protein [Actinomycetales bacterium]|nr:ABC transporter ATP-binding protein [Actinomycetales bacterium]